jgi:dihydrofolate reductase
VIGGAELFREALPIADRLYLAVVDTEVAGDTLMPDIDFSTWEAAETEAIPADDRNPLAFRFTRYERKRQDAE